MKILILCDHYGTGGGAGHIAQLQARRLSRNNRVDVLTAHSLKDNSGSGNLKVTTYNLDFHRDLRNYLGIYHPRAIIILKNYLRDNAYDKCYIHNLHTNWSYASLKVLKDAGIKTVFTFHDVVAVTPYTKLCGIDYKRTDQGYRFDYQYRWYQHFREAKWTYNPVRSYLVRRYLKLADRKIAVSRALAEFLRTNGIQVDKVVYNQLPRLEKVPSSVYGNTIFFGGRLSTSKGALLTVEYLGYLKKEYNLTPKLLVAGYTGVVTEKMTELAGDLGVLEQINFLGWVKKGEYEKMMGESGVVIVPSICFDSFPTVILEAMRLSRPVVATIFGGSQEMVKDAQTGYIRDPKDIGEFGDAIADILSDKDLAQRLGLTAYKRFNSSFAYDTSSE